MNKTSSAHRFIALKSYWNYIRPIRLRLLFVLALFTIANILLAIVPIFIGLLVQTLSESPIDTSRSWMLAWVLVGLSSFNDLFWRGSEFAYRGLLNEITFRYETYLFRSVITKPYPYFVDKLSGKIGSYITLLSTEFRNLLGNVLFDGSGQIIGILSATAILSSINWQTGAVFAAGILGMLLVGRYTLRQNMLDEAVATDKASNKNGIIYDSVANYPTVKAFHTESQESNTIDKEQTKTFLANQKAFLSGIIFWASMSLFVRHLLWSIIVLMNVWFFLEGTLTIGELATLLSTVVIFSSRIWVGVWYVSKLGQQMARVDEAHLYLFGPTTHLLADPTEEKRHINFSQELELRELSFAYPDKPDETVLDNISLHIKRGQKIGVVGRSGSGKSTLTKLLLGLYEIDSNALLVDGNPTKNSDFSRLVSFVPQDTALFHRSITDNIAYSSSDTPDLTIVKKVATKARADEFIDKLPDGYDTLIGERGVKLSGGQRQRVAIARAILQDKPILILDEATSALDSESEAMVQEALDELWSDKTVIAIAHRLSTLRHMDRIIVFEEGRIIEDGTHQELLAQGGTYAKLWSHQSGGFIAE